MSIHELQKAMAGVTDWKRKAVQKLVKRLEKLANNSNGYLARIDTGGGIPIELARPIMEAEG